MIEEHLSRIRLKEEESKMRLSAAEVEAAAHIEKERENGVRHLGDVRMECAELERSLIATARRNADEKISGLRAGSAKRLAALAVLARKNQGKALETIVKEFREGV